MIYLLDTNACIAYLNGRYPDLNRKLQTLSPNDIAICSIVKAELLYGVAKSKYPAQSLAKQQTFLQPYISLTFDDKAAEVFGRERARLEGLGTTIGTYDLMIAAIALANNLILVTNNTREFSRISGLKCEDWQTLP